MSNILWLQLQKVESRTGTLTTGAFWLARRLTQDRAMSPRSLPRHRQFLHQFCSTEIPACLATWGSSAHPAECWRGQPLQMPAREHLSRGSSYLRQAKNQRKSRSRSGQLRDRVGYSRTAVTGCYVGLTEKFKCSESAGGSHEYSGTTKHEIYESTIIIWTSFNSIVIALWIFKPIPMWSIVLFFCLWDVSSCFQEKISRVLLCVHWFDCLYLPIAISSS